MAKFIDAVNREWSIRFTIGSLPGLRVAGLNVSTVATNPKTLDVLDNPETLGIILWELCGLQAAGKGVSPEDFANGFDGPTIANATDALMEALADFSQRPAVAAAVKSRLPGMTAKVEAAAIRRMELAMEMTNFGLNDTGGSSPASSASTPAG